MANENLRSRRTAVALAIIVTFSVCFGHQLAAGQSVLDRPISAFHSANENAFEAILRFGRENKIPIGLVLDPRLCATSVAHLSIEQTSAREALQVLAKELPSYNWKLEDGVVVFSSSGIAAATSSFLTFTVPPYSIPEDTLQAQVAFAWMNIRASLRPSEGTAFSILGSAKSVKWPSITFNNLKVEQVLDRLVSRNGGGAWVLFPLQDIGKAADHRPFSVTGYSDDAWPLSPCASPEAGDGK